MPGLRCVDCTRHLLCARGFNGSSPARSSVLGFVWPHVCRVKATALLHVTPGPCQWARARGQAWRRAACGMGAGPQGMWCTGRTRRCNALSPCWFCQIRRPWCGELRSLVSMLGPMMSAQRYSVPLHPNIQWDTRTERPCGSAVSRAVQGAEDVFDGPHLGTGFMRSAVRAVPSVCLAPPAPQPC